MRRHHRRAYALLYMMAALPLIAVVGVLAVQVVDRALRAQRVATRQTLNDAQMMSLMRRLREDSRQAERATFDRESPGEHLRLRGPKRTVLYAVGARRVTRTELLEGKEVAVGYWSFRNADVGFGIERFDNERQLVWVRFTYRFEISKGLERSSRLAAAVPVGRRRMP